MWRTHGTRIPPLVVNRGNFPCDRLPVDAYAVPCQVQYQGRHISLPPMRVIEECLFKVRPIEAALYPGD